MSLLCLCPQYVCKCALVPDENPVLSKDEVNTGGSSHPSELEQKCITKCP